MSKLTTAVVIALVCCTVAPAGATWWCYTATGFTQDPWDYGAWACRPLGQILPPNATWQFGIGFPISGGDCRPGYTNARAWVILVGRGWACNPEIPQMDQDYVVLDIDLQHNSMTLHHFDRGSYTYICSGSVPFPPGSFRVFRVHRSETGLWRVYVDNALWGQGHHTDLPEVPGKMELMDIYCTGVTFFLEWDPSEWTFPYGTWMYTECPVATVETSWGGVKSLYR